MKKKIIEWLKTKKNYCYYESETDDFSIYNNRLYQLLKDSRVHYKDLNASKCYIVECFDKSIAIDSYTPNNYKYNFENFNLKHNEYLYYKVKMKDASKKFLTEDSFSNRVVVLDLLNDLKNDLTIMNKFLEKKKKYTFKNIFFDVNKNNVKQYINDATETLRQKSFPYQEFKNSYIDKIRAEEKLDHIGIFYPFTLSHNIFKNEFYLLEINHLRFQKNNNNFEKIVDSFYNGYQINSDKLKDYYFKLENYFVHPGSIYILSFAYIDPFKNLEKYNKAYKKIENHAKINKLDFNKLFFKLLDFLNLVQFTVVRFQHENLINMLNSYRTKERFFSVNELINIKIIEKEKKNDSSYNLELYNGVLKFLKEQPSNKILTKNTKVEDLIGYEDSSDLIKQNLKLVLDDLLNSLSKDDNSKLEYILDHFSKVFLQRFKEYKFKKEHNTIIQNMIKDLILFYGDQKSEKFSKPLNNKFEQILLDSKHLDLNKIIDFNFSKNFINKNSKKFERHIPIKINTEDGKIKYAHIWGNMNPKGV